MTSSSAEQLAGDEIAPDDPQVTVATAYLRHGIYEYNQRDVRTQWDNILNELIDVTADAFLGLGVGCARCHDHKFDPILRKDYFRLRAFFEPVSAARRSALCRRGESRRVSEARRAWEVNNGGTAQPPWPSWRSLRIVAPSTARSTSFPRMCGRFSARVPRNARRLKHRSRRWPSDN